MWSAIAVWTASCPAPLIWKKILFWRLSWISLSSIWRDVTMFRYTRRRSSRESPSYESAFGGAISVAIGRRLPEKGRATDKALRGRVGGGHRRVGGSGRRGRVPVRVRRAVFDDPSPEELAIPRSEEHTS